MPERPRLTPQHRPLRRRSGWVQLGLGDGALALAGLGPGEQAVLELLDGTRTLTDLYAVAGRAGCAPTAVDELVGLLRGHGLLADPLTDRLPALGPRPPRAARVLVGGSGELPRSVARAIREALREEPLATVAAGRWALDHAELALRSAHGDPPPSPPAGDSALPTLVVLTAYGVLDPTTALPWSRHGVAHLPVVAGPSQVTVGPLVGAAPGPDAPCLHCVEMHRCDRDPDRRAVLAQALPGRATGAGGPGPAEPPPALREAAAGIAGLVVAGQVAGHRLPAGVTVELSLPWPRVDHRRWTRHPRCREHESPARETMTG